MLFINSLSKRIETGSSGYAVSAVLNQDHPHSWHLVAYLTRIMTSAEQNNPIPEHSLVIYALNKWRQYVFGMDKIAYTDHSSLATWETNE